MNYITFGTFGRTSAADALLQTEEEAFYLGKGSIMSSPDAVPTEKHQNIYNKVDAVYQWALKGTPRFTLIAINAKNAESLVVLRKSPLVGMFPDLAHKIDFLLSRIEDIVSGSIPAPEDLEADVTEIRAFLGRGENMSAYLRAASDKRISAWRQSAYGGNPIGQWLWGQCFVVGVGVPKSDCDALSWFSKSAEQGFAWSQHTLGLCSKTGYFGLEDLAEAVKWFRKAVEQTHAESQYRLGQCYEQGEGVSVDCAEAASLYRKAGDQGHADAQYRLGRCYERARGVAANYAEAANWYRKAAEQGHFDAQLRLAECYRWGQGVAENRAEADKWSQILRKRAREHCEMTKVMELYLPELGIDDRQEEADLEQKEADLDADIQKAEESYKAIVVTHCQSVAEHCDGTARSYRNAAERGDPNSQYALGVCYEMGQGVAKSRAKAAKWYRMAAEQDHVDALLRLGDMYLFGEPTQALCERSIECIEKVVSLVKDLPASAERDLRMDQLAHAMRRAYSLKRTAPVEKKRCPACGSKLASYDIRRCPHCTQEIAFCIRCRRLVRTYQVQEAFEEYTGDQWVYRNGNYVSERTTENRIRIVERCVRCDSDVGR